MKPEPQMAQMPWMNHGPQMTLLGHGPQMT
jgi:hypothetical protein